MALKFSTGLKNQLWGAAKGAVSATASFANGVLYIYSGSQPDSADSAPTGTLLMIVTVDSGAFAWGSPTNGLNFDVSSGVLAKTSAIWSGKGIAAGIAGWFRLMGNAQDNLSTSTTLPRLDGRVAVSGAEMALTNTNIRVGVTTTIDTFTLSFPQTL